MHMSRLMRRVGLVLIALAVLMAPIGAVMAAAAPEASPHAHAVGHDEAAAPADNSRDTHATDPAHGASGAQCAMPSCHVVSGPLAAPLGGALEVLSPGALRLRPEDGRPLAGLAIEPPLGPPRHSA